jgi:CubicO group peptidase (beta-lactamase class C family)
MTTSRRSTLAGLAALGAMAALPSAARAEDAAPLLVGTWWGTLMVGPAALRLQLEASADGTGVVTSLDQGNSRIPVAISRTADGMFLIEAPAIGAVYRVRQNRDGDLQGTFTQGGSGLTLNMQRGAAPVSSEAPAPIAAMSPAELHRLRSEFGTPGMAAGWQRGNAAPTLIADGLRSAAAPRPVTTADQWHIGSITKSMTALLAARLVEAGVIGWDSTITSVLGPDLPQLHGGYASATLLHLLSHRAGIATAAAPARFTDFSAHPGPDIHQQRLAFIAAALTPAPQNAPGAVMTYANAGYITAGAMLEKLTGKPWETLIREQVFAPLHLRSAGIGLPGHMGRADQPVSHIEGPNGLRIPHFTDLPAAMGPAGLVHISLGDLLTYLSAHRDRPANLLRRESWDRLHTPPFGGNYALGWVVSGEGQLSHNGSNGYWFATVGIDRGAGIVAALAANDAAAIGQDARILQALGTAAAR